MRKPSTRDIIANTALELLQSKRVEDMTVAQIVHETGISNRTFYNHFRDKYDVCNYIYDRMLDGYCWLSDGRRSTLSEFFDKFSACMTGEYARFFLNTAFYSGQDNLQDHIVSRGVEDLKKQLMLTGNGELITEETLGQLEFYMRGLAGTMQHYARKRIFGSVYGAATIDSTRYLPQELYKALTAAPVENE